MALIKNPDDHLKVMSFKGLHYVDTKSMDTLTYIQPKPKGKSWLSHAKKCCVQLLL